MRKTPWFIAGWMLGGLGLWLIGCLVLILVAVAAWIPVAADEDGEKESAACTDTGAAAPAAQGGQQSAKWSGDQRDNAATIAAVAKKRALPPSAAQIAVATAIVESRLLNLDQGDRDSLGLFQQRPSQGWGTPAQVRDPVYAAGEFYDRLVKISGWQSKPLTAVAQSVQRSAYPNRYGVWESAARKLVTTAWKNAKLPGGAEIAVGEGECGPGAPDAPASARAKAVIAAARDELGTPYVWGGGNIQGPTSGGYDCSGLMLYAFYQGTDGKTTLRRTSQAQRTDGTHVPKNKMRPGDLIVINNDGNWGHVGLYLGNNRMIHSPRTGKDVAETTLDYWKQFPWDVRRVL